MAQKLIKPYTGMLRAVPRRAAPSKMFRAIRAAPLRASAASALCIVFLRFYRFLRVFLGKTHVFLQVCAVFGKPMCFYRFLLFFMETHVFL